MPCHTHYHSTPYHSIRCHVMTVYALVRRSLEAAQRSATAEAEVTHQKALSVQAQNDRLKERVRAQEEVVQMVEADRGRHASAHGALLRQVDKGKIRLRTEAIKHGLKVYIRADGWG